jgi:hypothetical protein
MLNYADDEGNLAEDLMELKVRILPNNDVDIKSLLGELINVGMVKKYEVEGKHYLHITNFKNHQVINRPSKPQCPLPPWESDSMSAHKVFSESSRGKEGMEGKGKEGKEKAASNKHKKEDKGRDWDTGLEHIRGTINKLEEPT